MTDDETVILDLDNMTLRTARYWARRAMKWHRLGGFVILKSSINNYRARLVHVEETVRWSLELLNLLRARCIKVEHWRNSR